jgi:hypothetical protein
VLYDLRSSNQLSGDAGLVARDDELAFRVLLLEYGSAPGRLGMVQMSFTRVPILAEPATSGMDLGTAIEQLQADLLAWERRQGAGEAKEIVDQLTRLRSSCQPWTLTGFP